MRIYKCILTGDEMFSDTYAIKEEQGFYVLKGQYVTRKGDDVDESAIGGNASAEDAAEDVDGSGTESGVDVCLDSRLKESGFTSKKDYQLYMKTYMKDVLAKLKEKGVSEDEIATLKDQTLTGFKAMCAKFKELSFYTGESQDCEGHIALVDWVDEEVDGKTVSNAYVYFYKMGMIAEKV